MRFTVPQFIERETPIVGPLTFRQFIFLGIAGAICFFLYFSLAKTSFFLFLVISIVVFAIALSLAFVQIGGRSLPTILVNALRFNLAPKIYLWKKKEIPVKVFKKEVKKEEKLEEELPLKIAEKSQLKKIKSSKGLY
ncbi:MAG: PrgI family protein [Patescibacteria group bacterium]|nr:PrgI family protein [Patescibacteria group bacterium]